MTIANQTLNHSTLDARSALKGRILVETGASLPSIDIFRAPHLGGLKVTGGSAAKHVAQLSRYGVEFPMIFDVESSVEAEATPQAPFVLASDGLFPQTLEDRLDEIRQVGATVAFTPTGHILPGNEALETAVQRSNGIESDDLVLNLPLSFEWLADEVHFERLTRQLQMADHVASISLAHQQDPFSEPGVGERVRRLASLDDPPFLDRADLAGLDYLVHGGLGASIGMSARLRHGQSPSIKGRPFNGRDGRTSVLWPGLMRFVRPKFLGELYPSASGAPECLCPFCDTEPLTSFTTKKSSQQRARNHNGWWIQRYTELILEDPAGRSPLVAWREIIAQAIEEHERLRVDLNRPNFAIPRSLELWAW